MELDMIDNLAKQMQSYYRSYDNNDKQKEHAEAMLYEADRLVTAISEFDIDLINSTLNKLKDKFNSYNEH
jgi:hypothetical protein